MMLPPSLGHAIDSYLYFAASIFWRPAAHRRKLRAEDRQPTVTGDLPQPGQHFLDEALDALFGLACVMNLDRPIFTRWPKPPTLS